MKNLHILFDVGSAKAGLLLRGYICYQVVLEMLNTSSHQLLKTTWSLLSLFLPLIYLHFNRNLLFSKKKKKEMPF